MENHHFEWDQLFLWAIFNSYVSTVSHYQTVTRMFYRDF